MRLLAPTLALLLLPPFARAAQPLSRVYLPQSGSGPASIGRLAQGLMRVHRGNLQAWTGVTFEGRLQADSLTPLVAALSGEQREELRRLLAFGSDYEAFQALMGKAGKGARDYARAQAMKLYIDERYERIEEDSLEDFTRFQELAPQVYGPYLLEHDKGELLTTLAKLQLRRDALRQRRRERLTASMSRYRAALERHGLASDPAPAVEPATLPAWALEQPHVRRDPVPNMAKAVSVVESDFGRRAASPLKARLEHVERSYDMLGDAFELGWTHEAGAWPVSYVGMLEPLKDRLVASTAEPALRRLILRRHAALLERIAVKGAGRKPKIPVKAFAGLVRPRVKPDVRMVKDLIQVADYYRTAGRDQETLRRIESGDDGKWPSFAEVRGVLRSLQGDFVELELAARADRAAAIVRTCIVALGMAVIAMISHDLFPLDLFLTIVLGSLAATAVYWLRADAAEVRARRFRALDAEWDALAREIASGEESRR